MNRTSGPTFAGYFCEPIPFFQVIDLTSRSRKIILDFHYLSPAELTLLMRSLILDTQRAGLRPLVDAQTPLYCESWYGNQGQGTRIDHVLALPEIAKSEWIKRAPEIRILLSALWGMIYEEGPGKSETAASAIQRTPKAYFQIAASGQCLVFRLYYYTVPQCLPKDAVKLFSPDKSAPSKASQLLLRYSDFVRVHTIQETSDIEIVVGLFPSAPSEKAHDFVHTLWIEPLSARLISEPPYEAPSPANPHLRALPTVSAPDNKPRLVPTDPSGAKDRAIIDATSKIKDLRKKIEERESMIRELRSGGVGTAPPLPPPDAEGLLEAFQQRYFDARFQIRQFEVQIQEIEKKGGSPKEIQTLRLKMEALINREKAWIKKLVGTLETYKDAVKKTKR
jgi:hypothetical protein